MTVFWKCPVVDFAKFVRPSNILVRHKFAKSIGGTLYNRSSTFSIISVSTSKIRSHHFPLPGFGFSLSRRLGDGVEGGRTKKQILLKFLWKELRDYRKLLQLISNRLPYNPQFKSLKFCKNLAEPLPMSRAGHNSHLLPWTIKSKIPI